MNLSHPLIQVFFVYRLPEYCNPRHRYDPNLDIFNELDDLFFIDLYSADICLPLALFLAAFGDKYLRFFSSGMLSRSSVFPKL